MVNCPNSKKIIRWRYPGENWSRIEGDKHTTEIERPQWYGGQRAGVTYQYKYEVAFIRNGTLAGWGVKYKFQPAIVKPPILDFRLLINRKDYGVYEHWSYRYRGSGNPPPDGSNGRSYIPQVKDSTGEWKNWVNLANSGHRVIGFEPTDGVTEEPQENCIFTVYKNSVIVYQRTKEECPEVEEYCENQRCPPGTCECRNGNLLCCYNPRTGIHVTKVIL